MVVMVRFIRMHVQYTCRGLGSCMLEVVFVKGLKTVKMGSIVF